MGALPHFLIVLHRIHRFVVVVVLIYEMKNWIANPWFIHMHRKKRCKIKKRNQKREKPNQKIIIITVKNQLNGRVFSFHSFCHKFMNWKHFFLSTFVYFYSMSCMLIQFAVCLKFNKKSWLNRKKRENYFTKICQKNSRYHLNSIKCKRFRCVSVYVHKIGRINGRF